MTTGDKILILCLIFLGITSFFWVNKLKTPGDTALIQMDGQIKYELKLNENKKIKLHGSVGESIIQIKNGSVRILHSDCPAKICVKSGPINQAGALIVCVPNKIVIRITGDKKDHFNVITQ